MSTTVLGCLENAKINFENLGRAGLSQNPFFIIAMDQLNNAIGALMNGKGVDFVVQDEMFGEIKK